VVCWNMWSSHNPKYPPHSALDLLSALVPIALVVVLICSLYGPVHLPPPVLPSEPLIVRSPAIIHPYQYSLALQKLCVCFDNNTTMIPGMIKECVSGIATVVAYGGSLTQSINQLINHQHTYILLPCFCIRSHD